MYKWLYGSSLYQKLNFCSVLFKSIYFVQNLITQSFAYLERDVKLSDSTSFWWWGRRQLRKIYINSDSPIVCWPFDIVLQSVVDLITTHHRNSLSLCVIFKDIIMLRACSIHFKAIWKIIRFEWTFEYQRRWQSDRRWSKHKGWWCSTYM